MGFARRLRKRLQRSLRRALKRRLGEREYVSAHPMTTGIRVIGDLGFLATRRLGPEDRFLMSLALDGRIVYDVGAHIGLLTLFFARRVGSAGRVVSFEPNPETFALLTRNVERNGLENVTLVNVGLAERGGSLPLVFADDARAAGTMDAVLGSRMAARRRTRSVEVEVQALDDLLAANAIPPPDLIKVDVEGYETRVLRGMRDTLRVHRPRVLLELHVRDDAMRAGVLEMLGEMRSIGYRGLDVASGAAITEDDLHRAGKHVRFEPD